LIKNYCGKLRNENGMKQKAPGDGGKLLSDGLGSSVTTTKTIN